MEVTESSMGRRTRILSNTDSTETTLSETEENFNEEQWQNADEEDCPSLTEDSD